MGIGQADPQAWMLAAQDRRGGGDKGAQHRGEPGLRSFTFGHVRQLDRLTEQLLTRAWAAGAGPGDGPMTIDLDSTVCEVHRSHKAGRRYGYTHTPPRSPNAKKAK